MSRFGTVFLKDAWIQGVATLQDAKQMREEDEQHDTRKPGSMQKTGLTSQSISGRAL
jgi:hypothetical protein